MGTIAAGTLATGQRWSRALITGIVTTIIVAAAVALYVLRPPLPPPRVIGSTQITSDGLVKGNLVTDGNRLYFGEISADRWVLSQVSSKGGETASIATPIPDPVISDISPDKSELLVVPAAARDLWLIPLPAGSPHRLDFNEWTRWSLDAGRKIRGRERTGFVYYRG